MTVGAFLKDQTGTLMLHAVSMLGGSLFLRLTGTSGGIIIILLIIWSMILLVSFSVRFFKARERLQTLQAVLENLDQKYLFAECIEKPKSNYERELFHLVRRSGKSMIEAVSDSQEQQREYREYVENWVHEIKAPITAAQLICQNQKGELSRKILPQLTQIEEHTERALYYARAGSVEKDFIIRTVQLSPMVAQAVQKHQALLIQNEVRIETDGLEQMVYTDEKWVVFLLGQLLSNAVRYRSGKPVVQIRSCLQEGSVCLQVTDNGIGIAQHDLPRVFDRGFTGDNGRIRGGSTGMGLYICKQLATFLQIQMKVESAEQEYTTVSLLFPAKESLTKM